METKQFKTSAACGGCALRISKGLSKLVPESQFSIDIKSSDKVLTITSDLTDVQIIEAVKDAGYIAQRL